MASEAESLSRLGGTTAALNAGVRGRVIIGPLQPGDLVTSLSVHYASNTGQGAGATDPTVQVRVADSQPPDDDTATDNIPKVIQPTITLFLTPSLSDAVGGTMRHVVHANIPLVHKAGQTRGRWLVADLTNGNVVGKATMLFDVFRSSLRGDG